MLGMLSSLELAGPVGSAAPSPRSASLVVVAGAVVVDPSYLARTRLVKIDSSPASRVGDRALDEPGEQAREVRMKIAAMQVFLSETRDGTAG